MRRPESTKKGIVLRKRSDWYEAELSRQAIATRRTPGTIQHAACPSTDMAAALLSHLPRSAPRLRLCRRLAPLLAISLLVNPFTLEAAHVHLPYKVSILWSPLIALTLALLLACATEIAIAVLRPALGMLRGDARLVLDEGGARIVRPRPRGCVYVPYDRIGACMLFDNGNVLREVRRTTMPGPDVTALRGAALIAHDVKGEHLFELALPSLRSTEEAGRLLDVLERRPLDLDGPGHLQSLRRNGLALGAWATQLRDKSRASGSGPYRTVVPCLHTLVAAIADPALPIDVRVGAVFAASVSGSAPALGGVDDKAPPLLLAAIDAVFPSRRTARLVARNRVRSQLTDADWRDLRILRGMAPTPGRTGGAG